MKKISLMILGLLLGISSITYANGDEKVNHATLTSFQHDFKSATEVSWTFTPACYKAEFSLNGQVMNAYYDKNDSRLVAMTRFILSTQLPINLQRELRSKVENGWISDLFEVVSDGETFYYATVENDASRIVYKSTGFSSWIPASKTDKE